MSSRFRVWAAFALAALIATGGLHGCTEQVGTVDTTQAIRIPKEAFGGVWYYVRTVADVPFSTATTFQGEMYAGSLQGAQKIMFDVQESLLVVYPVWEVVEDAEAPYERTKIRRYWEPDRRDEFIEVYVGQPIAAWAIESHFDVIYDYNTSTGEKSNLLVENSTDRNWWERDYIRVDWNSEEVGDIGFVTGSVEATSMQFVGEEEQDPLNPDKPDFEEDYIGIVTQYFVAANPSGCALWGLYRNDCSGAGIKVRHSFKKANPAEDAITQIHTNREHQDKFGYFLSDRYAFDPQYGITETIRDYKAQLWNLWDVSQSWEDYVDPMTQTTVGCMTQSDCPDGARCMASDWFEDGVCRIGTPLPYRERGLQPIIYHLSHSHPGLSGTTPIIGTDEDGKTAVSYEGADVLISEATGYPHPYMITAYETADEWNDVFRDTVAWVYQNEDMGNLHAADNREGARACETNIDCISGNDGTLTWSYADTAENFIATCQSNADCVAMSPNNPANAASCVTIPSDQCDSSVAPCQVCADTVLCGETNSPCPLGSTCVEAANGAECQVAGQPLYDPRVYDSVRGYTFVAWADADDAVQTTRLIDRILPTSPTAIDADTQEQNALIRFVNGEGGTTLSLRGVTSDPAENSGDGALAYDEIFSGVSPQPDSRSAQEELLGHRTATYADSDFPYAVRSAIKYRRVEVVDGNTVVGSMRNVSVGSGDNVVFAYADGRLMVVSSDFAEQGVRAINAVPESIASAVDFGLDSILMGRNVPFGESVDYRRPMSRGVNNFTVLMGGSPGNVVCYDDVGVGKCVGWAPEMGDAAIESVESMLAGTQEGTDIPAMFVLCQPIYHGDDCTEEEMGNMSVYNDCRYSRRVTDPDTGENRIENPCKDRVPHPYGLKKNGDIRYNFFYWINKAQAASPLGYGPSAADPEYGNLFYGIANIYGAALITYGDYAKDLIDLMNGNLSTEDVMSGSYVSDFVKGKQAEFPDEAELASQFEGLMLGTSLSGQSSSNSFATAVAPVELPPALQELTSYLPSKSQMRHRGDFINAVNHPAFQVDILPDFHKGPNVEKSARLGMIKDSWVADLLVTPEIEAAAASEYFPGMELDETTRDRALDLAISPDSYYRLQSQRNFILQSNNIYMADFNDDALFGIAEEMGCTSEKLSDGVVEVTDYVEATMLVMENDKREVPPTHCLSGAALKNLLTARLYGGVMEHEVGHTVSLRHNFASSGDVFNFFDEWYGIRDRDPIMCLDDFGCDISRGEFCRQTCTSNADCPTQATCDELGGQNVCVDKSDDRGDLVGWCMAPSTATIPQESCSFSQAAAIPGTNAPFWDANADACVFRTFCDDNADCSMGEECSANSFCVNEITQEPLQEPAIDNDCNVDADCFSGTCAQDGDGNLGCADLALHIAPKATLSESERAQKRVEYQDSTVMDYGQKVNSHIHGLGKYDYAAIKFGYGGLVEVYKDTSHIDEYVENNQALGVFSNSTLAFYRSSSSWMESLNHPYRFLNHVLGPDNAGSHNRISVPWQQVKLDREMNTDYLNDDLYSNYIEVTYGFCSDEFRGNGGCYIFDAGVDDIEVVQHSMDMLRQYYIFDAFKRDRWSFGWGSAELSYYARIRDRWMSPMRNAGLYDALYTHLFADLGFWEQFAKEPLSGLHFGLSSRMAFQYLYDLVASPAPGTYLYDADENMYRHATYELDAPLQGDTLTIGVGMGKFPHTTYDSSYGYHMYNHPVFVGSIWEKMAAIEVLSENDTTFLSDYVGEDLEIGIKSAIGFSTAYPTELVNLFGGIASDSYDYWAGVVDLDEDGVPYYRPRQARDPLADVGLPLVEPSLDNLGFKSLTTLYAVGQVAAAFDTSILDAFGVIYEESADDYNLAEGVEWYSFEDPFGNKTYLALVPNFDSNRVAAAKRVIDQCNDLKDAWLNAATEAEAAEFEVALREKIEVLDMMREMTKIYGQIVF